MDEKGQNQFDVEVATQSQTIHVKGKYPYLITKNKAYLNKDKT